MVVQRGVLGPEFVAWLGGGVGGNGAAAVLILGPRGEPRIRFAGSVLSELVADAASREPRGVVFSWFCNLSKWIEYACQPGIKGAIDRRKKRAAEQAREYLAPLARWTRE